MSSDLPFWLMGVLFHIRAYFRRDKTVVLGTRASWEPALREAWEAREPRDRSRTQILPVYLGRGPVPGGQAPRAAWGRCHGDGGGWHRGGRRGATRGLCLARPAGRLGAGSTGGRGKGGRWSAHGLSPGNPKLQVGRGLGRSLAAASTGNRAAAARQWRAGRLEWRPESGRAY